ncbi:Panacea domain-containing protein [Palleronia caenipelagi]|uniref:DUF4065 domain-containing protein n=1 Tax=Palleronia caenipelagi TaxID=2489174 RepID=A0A547QA78_9RHOB|nr:type II toxin-antitoxin system antitoxin SocA domain-containing protein [Palleronia caenipelagi]TRD23271.1 DUF4065 domain-containing protein [Palleronia caenipelagi]
MERANTAQYDARQIANWFIDRAAKDDRELSIMTILKLVYIAHGWHLETTKRPLFANRIEAWRYGPVIPDVYNAFRKQGVTVREQQNLTTNPFARAAGFSNVVGSNDQASIENIEQDSQSLLSQVYDIYGKLSAFQLSDLTHIEGGPWDIAVKAGGYFTRIPDDLIREHYEEKRAKVEETAA